MTRWMASRSTSAGLAQAVVLRVRQASRFQARGHPFDRLVVFGVDDDEGLVLARRGQHGQRLAISQEAGFVGQEEFDRPVAGGHQRWQFPLDHGRAGIGDDDVKTVVDHRLAGSRVVILGPLRDAVTLELRREADHAGGAPERGRGRRTLERIGVGRVVGAWLFDVAMTIDPAG